MSKLFPTLTSIILLTISVTAYAQYSTDDFESGTFSEGTGAWTTNWIHSDAGGSFVNTGSEIDGTGTGALYTSGDGISRLTRSFTTQDEDGSIVFASWSLKGLQNASEIGVTLIGSKSDAATNIVTMQFFNSGSNFTLNDGGSNFGVLDPVPYFNDTIYDMTFSSEIGSNSYSWSVSQRGVVSDSDSFTYSGGATLTDFSGIQFFWDAPSGSGNDGLIDSVVVPEPSSIIMLGLTGLATGMIALLKRRKRA